MRSVNFKIEAFAFVPVYKRCMFLLVSLTCLLLAACASSRTEIDTQAHIVDKINGLGQQLAWSPDNKSLSFIGGDPRAGGGQLVIFDLITRKSKNIGEHEWSYDAANRWSPDGTQIVVEKENEIWMIRVADGQAIYVTKGEDAAWSADGKLLAVLRGPRTTESFGFYQVVFVTPAGVEKNALSIGVIPTPKPAPTPLATVPDHQGLMPWSMSLETHLAGFDWSPDNRRLAYAVYFPDEDRRDLYIIQSDGANPRRLNMDGSSMEPAWSPRSDQIAFIHSLDNVTWDLYIASANGKCQIRLTHGGYARDPAWSPDGSKIAVLDSESGIIYILDVERFITDNSFDSAECKQ